MNTYALNHKNTVSYFSYRNRVRIVYALLVSALFLVGMYGALIGKAAFAASNVQKINHDIADVQSTVDSLQAKVAYSKSLITKADVAHFGMAEVATTEFIQKATVGFAGSVSLVK